MLAGPVFVVLWVAGSIVGNVMQSRELPRPDASTAEMREYFAGSATGVAIDGGLQVLAALALAWFTGVLADLVSRRGRQGATPQVVLAAGGVSTGLLLVGAAAMATFGSDFGADGAVSQMLFQLAFWLGGPLHYAALGVMVAAAAHGLGGTLFPRWLTVIGRYLCFLWILVATIMIGYSGRGSLPVMLGSAASSERV